MSAIALQPSRETLHLDGISMTVPDVQVQPLHINRIAPAPCGQACPAGINVKAYVSLIAERRFSEALSVIRERCCLPGICGRVCHHPCESACRRGEYDDPIAIRALKRFAADAEPDLPRPDPPPAYRSARIAIIGSGPAGLTAAHDLRRAGYPVTVFEMHDEPGGMLRYGIAAYRLPRDILDREIDILVSSGIEIRTGMRLGRDFELRDLRAWGYEAVLLAVGAQSGRRLGIAGENGRAEIQDALSFLERVNAGDHFQIHGKVLVVGGGSTAIEAARSAVRLGAESVEILYRRSAEEMPASAEELEVAQTEGVHFRWQVVPKRVVLDHTRLQGLECLEVALGDYDASGRRRPVALPGSEFLIEGNHVLSAVGQQTELGFLTDELAEQLVENNRLRVDPENNSSTIAGFFAAGDAVSGPATVIEAIADGHRAAESIRRYLEGVTESEQRREKRPAEYELPPERPSTMSGIRPTILSLEQGDEFGEVERPLTAEQAVAEAQRCLRCGPCGDCLICASSCSHRHVLMDLEPTDDRRTRSAFVRAPLRFTRALDQAAVGMLAEGSSVALRPARVHIDRQACRGCGSCVQVCPFDALHLTNGISTEAVSQLDASLCRGCNLCTAVCPTGSIVSTALTLGWWEARLQDISAFVSSDAAPALPYIVLACERRVGTIAPHFKLAYPQIVRLRCVGQITPGMLVQLYLHGAGRILIAGCDATRCRYRGGIDLAIKGADIARPIIRMLGGVQDCIAFDSCDADAQPSEGIGIKEH